MQFLLILFLFFLIGFLIGSIPFGVLVAKIWRIDIRKYGSGNIGAANVLRALGVFPGAIVFVLDFLKGMLAVYLGYWVGGKPEIVLALGISVIFGHMFSIFLGFRGGRGAATGMGVLAGLAPEIFVFAAIFATALVLTTRYVSIASILTSMAVAILMFVFNEPILYSVATLLVVVFIVVRHIPNIKRLLLGTEPRIGEET